MIRYLKIYRLFFRQFMKRISQSSVDLWMGIAGFLVLNICGVYTVSLIFQNIPDLQGWSYWEIVFIYGISLIPRGVDHTFTDYIWILGNQLVRTGGVDRYLLRPLNPLFQICADRVQPDGLGEVVTGIAILTVAIPHLSLNIGVIWILSFLLMTILGAIIYTAIKLLFASVAFWIKNSGPLLQIAYNAAEFGRYPISIYPAGVRFIIMFIFPFAFVAYFPASFLLGRAGFIESIGMEALAALVFFCLAYFVFSLGIKQYESTGN